MFLDTNVLVDIFMLQNGEHHFDRVYRHIQDDQLFMSVLQVGEIGDWCLRYDLDVGGHISLLKEFINMVPLYDDLCVGGSEIKRQMRQKGSSKFSLTDGIILASARSIGQKVLTRDKDFALADDVVLLDR